MADQRCKRCGRGEGAFIHIMKFADNFVPADHHPFEPEDAAPAPKDDACPECNHSWSEHKPRKGCTVYIGEPMREYCPCMKKPEKGGDHEQQQDQTSIGASTSTPSASKIAAGESSSSSAQPSTSERNEDSREALGAGARVAGAHVCTTWRARPNDPEARCIVCSEPFTRFAGEPAAQSGAGGEDAWKCQRAFESVIGPVRAAAKEAGYAIAVHGSLERDIDLIAVPWSDGPLKPQTLALAIKNASNGFFIKADEPMPRQKSHGRLCWSIHLGGGPYIDLSVMPPTAEPAAGQGAEQWLDRWLADQVKQGFRPPLEGIYVGWMLKANEAYAAARTKGLEAQLAEAKRMVRVAENAFKLQDAVDIPGNTGKMNCLQIAKAWRELERKTEAAETRNVELMGERDYYANRHKEALGSLERVRRDRDQFAETIDKLKARNE